MLRLIAAAPAFPTVILAGSGPRATVALTFARRGREW
jgi:hypothetical protein